MHEEVAGNTNSRAILARVQALIGAPLKEMEGIFQEELDAPQPFIREVLDHLMHYRGKRLRPMLLLLSAEASGQLATAHAVLGAVVEMIHTATLVHDDVLDDATTRRHVTTVNARWNTETSVLLGDYLFTHAFHLTSSLGSALACRLIGRATNRVCEGELWQVSERGNLHLTEEQYLEIIEAKTAELCAVSCYLGAHYAGAAPAVTESLDRFGRSLGIAFQIADDLLDVQGTEAATGKSLGSDLRKQKLTLPVIYMLARLPAAEAAACRDLLAAPGPDTARLLQPYLDRTHALEYARARANEYVVAARQSLACLNESPARALLEEMADFVTQRTC